MPAERVSMRRIREILRLKHECRATDREIARSLSVARSTVALTLERVAAAGSALAVAGDADRPCAGGDAVCRPRWSAGRAAQGGPRLGACPSRAAPPRRHADAAVGGVSSAGAGRLSLQSLVRAVPRLGKPVVADDAPGSSRRRAD